MGSFSDYLENKVLDHIVGKTDYDLEADVFMALVTTDPIDADDGSTIDEVPDASGYARVDTVGLWAAAAAGSISNSAAITFAAATGDWAGDVVGWCLMDGDTHGADEVLAWGTLDHDKTVSDGDVVKFAIGDLTITLT